jgi:hypothetical protein
VAHEWAAKNAFESSGGIENLFMTDWNSPIKSPYLFLVLGCLSFSAALVWTFIGKAWVRFYGWVYRSEEPKWFWWEVFLDCVVGGGFIGYFLYKVY